MSIGSDSNGNQRYHTYVNTSGFVQYHHWDNDFQLTTGAVAANTWNHVITTYNAATNTQSIYINGSLI